MMPQFGGGDKCPRCDKCVYQAEEKTAVGKKWHKMCLNCKECHKMLDSTSLADREGEIYCRGCHGRQFGPTGFGYGAGAGHALNYTGKTSKDMVH